MSQLGDKIREIRKLKKITLVELAKTTGVAQASLSRIETGVMTGTVDSHQKIAEALGVSIGELYEKLDMRVADIAQHEPSEDTITHVTDSVKLEVLTTNTTHKKIVPVLFTLDTGSQIKADRLERGVERFYWVVKGEVMCTINDKEYQLKQNHTIYFDASLSHHLRNNSSSSAQVFCATSPPKI
ncbi:MAG: XRE family transcriptional regulator [Candidatus Omnitrophica bacterium]|nr:XRE family transcriptional regulator [Candidatus Omnitrophota bacterium]